MAVVTSTSAIDWTSISQHGAAFNVNIADLGNRFETLFDEFIAGAYHDAVAVTGQLTVQMDSGGQLTAVGTNLDNLATISISSFTFSDANETLVLKGTFNSVGATDPVTEATYTLDGQKVSLKGNLTVTANSGDYTGTISSVSLLTSDGYTITLTGAGLTATRVGTTTETAGTFNKAVIAGPGSATPLWQMTGFALVGLPAGFETIGDFLATLGGNNDSVSGGAGNDLLLGYGGNDTILGLGGSDTLDGGNGNDSQDGGLGNDSYIGSAGNDTYVIAQAGDSIDAAGAGTDQDIDTVRLALATGTAFNDLTGFAGLENVVFTGTGAVTLTGNANANLLSSGAGNDSISGGDGNDSLVAAAGNDTLHGGAGEDTMSGGAGNDYYVYDNGADLAVEATTGGGTGDTAEVAFGNDASLIEYLNIENLVLATATGVGTGTAVANSMTSKNGTHTLAGGFGNDTYFVQAEDAVSEDTGTGAGTVDLVIYTSFVGEGHVLADNIESAQLNAPGEHQYLNGNALNNKLTGNSGLDYLNGGEGNDTLIGNGGDDQLISSAGKDSLVGGLGNDVYYVDLINLTATTLGIQDLVGAEAANAGDDTLVLMAGAPVTVNTTALAVTLGANFESLEFSGTTNALLVNATGNGLNNWINANAASSKLDGAAGNDSINGGGGADTLLGGAGNDTLDGGEGNDSLDGGLGNDVLQESFGDDVFVIAQAGDSIEEIEANSSIDTVRVALAGNTYLDLSDKAFLENVVFTGAGPVTLRGNAGANSLLGGAGADSFYGGLGNDSYGVNSLLDKIDDEGGTDTAVASVTYSIADMNGIENLTLSGTAAKATGNGGANVLTGNAAANTLDGGAGADTMIGGNGADIYVVDNVGDVIQENTAGALGGIDQVNSSIDFNLDANIEKATVTGAVGRALTGNELANTLSGSSGNDTLDGGAGNDSLVGGLGNDTYIVNSTADKITDTGGNDTVQASITFSIAAAPTVENITLTGSDAINATGNAGANVLNGNSGNNSISGAAGNDTIDGGGGADSISGGDGDDVIGLHGNAEFQINSTATGSQSFPVAAALEDGSFLVSWASSQGDVGVYAQLFDAAGNPSGTEFLVGNSFFDWIGAGATSDGFVVAWVAPEGGIAAQRIDPTGAATGAVIDVTSDSGIFPSVGATEDGFVIGWQSGDGAFAQLFDSDGEAVGDSYLLDAEGYETRVMGLADGGFVAAWVTAGDQDGDGTGIFGQRFDSNGSTVGSEFQINATTAGGQEYPSFAGFADGGFVVAYVSDLTDEPGWGIRAVLFDADGEAVGEEIEVSTLSSTRPVVAVLSDGGFVVSWVDMSGHGDGSWDVFARVFDADGEAASDAFQVNTYALGSQEWPAVVALSDGSFVVSWQSMDQDGDDTGVFGKRFSAGDESISGGSGNDILAGSIGRDTLDGGTGNDTFEFDAADTIVEAATGGGIDTVRSSTVDITSLALNVENALLTGDVDLDATGNAAANVITGNTGDNALKGLGGNDALIGGDGNDTAVYVGNQADYVIVELSPGVYQVSSTAEGTDTLTTIENITFADAADLVLSEMDLTPPAPEPSLKAELDSGDGARLFGSGTIQISFSFMSAEPSYTFFPGHESIAAPNNDLKEAIRDALQIWEEIANINFTEATDAESVQFRFATELVTLPLDDPFDPGGPDTSLAAYAFLPTSSPANGASLDQGDVWINRNFFLYDDSAAAGFVVGTSMFSTLVHEIGHALGLDHPFNDGGDGEVFLADDAFDNNNLYSIMAYDSAPNSALVQWADLNDFWYGYGGTVEARTPMLYDISTIQAMYGANTSTRDGHTTYGTNVADGGYAFGIDQPFFLTIWDGDGNDTIDVSHLSLPSIVDLRPGHFSSIGMSNFLGLNDLGDHVNHGVFLDEGDTVGEEGYDYLEPMPEAPFGILDTFAGDPPSMWPDQQFIDGGGIYNGTNNLTIAETAVIENAIGGSGSDQLIGSAWSNRLSGRGGADTLTGNEGADRFVFDSTLNGTTNVDRITDFASGVDKIELDQTIFTALALGALTEADLATLVGTEHIRYAANGDLFYDSNGVGGAAEVKFATLAGHPALVAGDFLVVA